MWEKGIGLPGDNMKILAVARHLCDRAGVTVLGGLAVILHGYPRTTTDLDLYTVDREETYERLHAAGARWRKAKREHVFNEVSIHTVTPDDARHRVQESVVVQGVRVVGLADLVAIKLICGLDDLGQLKHLGDVQELILRVPLDKRLANRLPNDVRAQFKAMVDAV